MLLDVPYYYQLKVNSKGKIFINNYCGQASVRMLFGAYLLRSGQEDWRQGVEYCARLLGIPPSKVTGPWDLHRLAGMLGRGFALEIKSKIPTGLTLENIRYQIEEVQRPVIALIMYSAIEPYMQHTLRPFHTPFTDFAHYIPVIGTDGDDFIIHDPYRTNDSGKELVIPAERLEAGLNKKDNGYFANMYQGLIDVSVR